MGSITRRDFTRKSLLLAAALGSGGLIGYGILDKHRLIARNNLLRMGHCAPSVMQTLLGISDLDNDNLILASGGMAGGIAGPETECGALTAPLMFLSFTNNNIQGTPEKIEVIEKSQSYFNDFTQLNGSPLCGRIRYSGGQSACRKAVCRFHRTYTRAVEDPTSLSPDTKKSYSLLLEAFNDNKFHCAHNVLDNLPPNFVVSRELYDSSWIFIGGIAMLNRPCGALAAGVMALSSVTPEIENSYSRVARMNRMLKKNDPQALDEEINEFNRAINLSEELGSWFRNEFGSFSCRDIWGYDFTRYGDAENFINGHCMEICSKNIAGKVARKVSSMA